MSKKLELKNIKYEDKVKTGDALVELMRLLKEGTVKPEEAETNKIGMKDTLGRQVLF